MGGTLNFPANPNVGDTLWESIATSDRANYLAGLAAPVAVETGDER